MEAALAAHIWILAWGPLLLGVLVVAGVVRAILVFPHFHCRAGKEGPAPRPPLPLAKSVASVPVASAPAAEAEDTADGRGAPEASAPAQPLPQAARVPATAENAPFLARLWKREGLLSASLRNLAGRPPLKGSPAVPAPPKERRAFLRLSPPPDMVRTCRFWFLSDGFVPAPGVQDGLTPLAGHEAELLNISAAGIHVLLFTDVPDERASGHSLLIRLVLQGLPGKKEPALWVLARTVRMERGERSGCVQAGARFLYWHEDDSSEAPEEEAAPLEGESRTGRRDAAPWRSTDERGAVPPLHAWILQTHLNTQRNAMFASLAEWDGTENRQAPPLRDDLTGVGNEAFFFRNIEGEWKRSREQNRPLSCLVVELRHFNTFLRGQAKDAARQTLKTVALLICENVRVGDSVARVGGNRFYVTLPETGETEGSAIAAALRREIEHMEVPTRGRQGFPVSVGVGLSSIPGSVPSPGSVVAFLAEAERDLRENAARPGKAAPPDRTDSL